MQSIAWSLLMLVLVVATIPAALWIMKRLQTLRGNLLQRGGAPAPMEILGQLHLGPRERVVMVRVPGKVLVLGATAGQINLLVETTIQPAPGSQV